MPRQAEPKLTDARAPLLSKLGRVTCALACDLLNYESGQRLPSVADLGVTHRASTGTTQTAIRFLQSTRAIVLQTRGRGGSFVEQLAYPRLWGLAFDRPVVASLPLPYSRRFEGLATGLRTQFNRNFLNLDLRFMRGAPHRLRDLAARNCDCAVTSRFSADAALGQGMGLEVVSSLGPDTYMTDHVLLIANRRTRGLRSGMRVGYDPLSTDHAFIVRTVTRGHDVQLVEIDHSQSIALLKAGEIDATVMDAPQDVEGMLMLPVQDVCECEDDLATLREATVVVRAGDRAVANVLRAVLDIDELRQVQQQVDARLRLPMY